MTTKQIKGPESPILLQRIQGVFNLFKFLNNCEKKYGDIFTTNCFSFYGDKPIVIVSDPEAIKQLFNQKEKVLEAPAWTNAIFKHQLGEKSLILKDGISHQKQRNLLMPPTHKNDLLIYGNLIYQITQGITNKLKVGQEFIVRDLTEEITMDVILKVVFGISTAANYEKLKKLMTSWLNFTSSPLTSSFLLFPILQKDLGKLSPWGFYMNLRREINNLLMDEIKIRRKNLKKNSDNLLSLIMRAEYENGEKMTDEELRDNLLTLLVAGHETTSTALAWAFYWIEKLTEVKEKLLQEINTASKNINPIEISRLPYLSAVCQETLRIYPVIALTFPRVTTKSIELNGYKIDKNTLILPSIYSIHHREDLYPNSFEFRPERFLNRKYSPYEFLPFGIGSRQCLGQIFALFEMKIILATILFNYQFLLKEKFPVTPTRRGLLFAPKGGIKMILKQKL